MAYVGPTSTKLITSTPVTWSDGALFSGYLLLGLALPTDSLGAQWAEVNLYGTSQILPKWTVIPIIEGTVDNNTSIFPNTQLDPPNTKYAVYWYDNTWKLVYPFPAGTLPSLVTITGTTYTITQPTLIAPTSATADLTPAPQTGDGTTSSNTQIYAIPVEYSLTGTVNGVNTTFTIPVQPKVFASIFIDGQKQDASNYSRIGATVIFVTAPSAGSSITGLVI